MSFTEEWFDTISQDRLAELGRLVEPIEGLIIEIGSWEGRSTCVLANAVRPRPMLAIDTWEGSPGEISAELAAERDVYATWRANVKLLTGGNVAPVKSGWREFVPRIQDPVALCFIDAEHTYREVYDNIEAILPHLAVGGVLCGDDAGHPPVREAIAELLPLEDVYVKGNVWSWVKPANYTPGPGSELARLYAKVSAEPSDIYEHLPKFVQMVKDGAVTKVIELGTRTGVSTIAWLYALEQTDGYLWSVDIDAKPAIGDYDHWTFIQGDDESDVVLSQLPEQVDIVFLDTSHHYEHTLRELRLYRSQVRPGGLIVCHDTQLDYPEGAPPSDPRFPVKRAIEQFIRETGFRWVNHPECWGLGIIEVV